MANLESRPSPFGVIRQRGVSPIAAIRLAASGCSAITVVFLARTLGASDYGRYSLLQSWVAMASVLGGLGLDRLLVKYVAVAVARQEWASLKGVLRWSRGAVGVASLLACALLALAWPAGLAKVVGSRQEYFGLAAGLVLLTTMSQVQQAALRGFRWVVISQVPDGLIQPAVKVAGVGLVYLAGQHRLSLHAVLVVMIVAGLTGCGVGAAALSQATPPQVRRSPSSYAFKAWTTSSLTLLLLGGFEIMNGQVDILAMGMWGAGTVGVYAVIQQIARLLPFGLTVVTLVCLPDLARLHALGDQRGLQGLLRESTRLGFWVSGALGLGLAAISPWLLPYLRVDEPSARAGLAILATGQLINAAFGPVAGILVMAGHERVVTLALGLGLAINTLLCMLLIPRYGILGGALASTAGLVIWNLVLAWEVQRRLQLTPTILALARPRIL
jgi:O-antigen/teichoic acid export membrane protein